MVFKKPYAFLIKYFKIINLVLTFLAGYVAYRTYRIIDFFDEYINNNYIGNYFKGFYTSYISPFLYIIIILIILGVAGIIILFLYKKKPIKIYLLSIVYYIILIVYFSIVKNTMIILETNIIAAETSRIFYDLSAIALILQIPLIILFLIRGLGFNIKQFNFQQDLKELEIDSNDNEEVEVTFKGDTVKLKRNARRFRREFIYYVKENNFFVSIILIALFIYIVYILFNALPEIVDKEYKQGDAFTSYGLNYNIEDSIITNIDYKGDTFENDTYYIVAKLHIKNTTEDSITFDYNSFRLQVKKDYLYPIVDKNINFIDYAEVNNSKNIKANSEQTYSLVYKLDSTKVKKNYNIKIDNGSILSKNIIVGRYNYVTITPIIINSVSTENNINIGNELSFLNSNLRNSTLTLSNPEITDRYIYEYVSCVKSNCEKYKDLITIDYTKNNKTLIVMDYKYYISKDAIFYKYSTSIKTFIDTFMKVKYKINDEYKYANAKNATPIKMEDKIAIETTNEIKKASEIYISITIRNKEYLIKMK